MKSVMGWPFKHLVEAKILAIANAADSRRQEHIEADWASAKDGALRLRDAGEDTDPVPPFGTARVDRLILGLPYAALLELQALMWVGEAADRKSSKPRSSTWRVIRTTSGWRLAKSPARYTLPIISVVGSPY